MHKCKTCNGRGVKVMLRQLGPGMVQQMQSICPDCHGQGKFMNIYIKVSNGNNFTILGENMTKLKTKLYIIKNYKKKA